MIEVAGESPVMVLLAEKVWQGPSIHHRLPRLTRKRRQHLTMLVDSYSSEEQAKNKGDYLNTDYIAQVVVKSFSMPVSMCSGGYDDGLVSSRQHHHPCELLA
jgi:hypothetical protein